MSEGEHGREITIEQMLDLRAFTEKVAGWLRAELQSRLDVLKPVLHPRRFLGEHLKGPAREDAPDADRALADMQAAYKAVAGEPLRLPGKLESPLDAIPMQVEAHPWEYAHVIDEGGTSHSVTVRSPVSWVLLHSSSVGLSHARTMVAGASGRSDAELRQFAVHALAMRLVFDRLPALSALFGALRYRVDVVTSPETGKLPLVRVTSAVTAFRPADKVILSATRLSGTHDFEELVDPASVPSIADPFREHLEGLAGSR